MKIVVTGALGHIGSSLVRHLGAEIPHAHLLLIDNLSTQRFCSLMDLPKHVNYSFLCHDVRELNLENAFSDTDVVIHLAARTDAESSVDAPDEVERNNLEATSSVATHCAKIDAPLIHISSTSVYGVQNTIVDEDCSQEELKPQSPYAETKLREEALLKRLGQDNGLRYTCCRFGTIFGVSKGMRFHTAVNKFCWQAITGLPLSVWETALQQKRPYLELNDACSSITHIIEKQLFSNQIFNVLTLNATVKEIIDTIKIFEPKTEIKYTKSRIMNQLSYEVSNKKFSDTGFVFKGKLRETIEDYFNTFGSLR